MLTQKTTLALLLATFTVAAIGCGDSPTPAKKPDGGAGSGGTAGSTGTAGAGTAGAGTAGTGGAGTGGGTAGAAAGSDGGVDAPITQDAPPEVPPYMPDGGQGHSWLFNTSTTGIDGWHFTIYGSTPSSTAANNLALLSGTPVWDGTNDADNLTTSGSLKGTVPFTHTGEQIDFQAFTSATGVYDWRGYTVSAKVKLVSGGNINAGCPLSAVLYVSQAPDYGTKISAAFDLVKGTWVTLKFNMSDAFLNTMMISQMGIQIVTGGACFADAGAPDSGTDAVVDAGTADGAASDSGADGGDAGSDVLPPPPITATTAVILVDDVIVSVTP